MALTDSQKVDVRLYLGYPSLYSDAVFLLNSALDDLDTATEAKVIDCLTELADVDDRLSNLGRKLAGFTRAEGDAEFAAGQVLKDLRSEGRVWVNRLATLLGIDPIKDVYSGSANQGSAYFPFFG